MYKQIVWFGWMNEWMYGACVYFTSPRFLGSTTRSSGVYNGNIHIPWLFGCVSVQNFFEMLSSVVRELQWDPHRVEEKILTNHNLGYLTKKRVSCVCLSFFLSRPEDFEKEILKLPVLMQGSYLVFQKNSK